MKGDRDLASEVDFAVEELVRKFLHSQTPTAGFLGEEEGGSVGTADRLLWVLDPVDGTVNLLYGLPLCAVSLSVIYGGAALAAIIDLPFIGTQYTAIRGRSSHANGKRLHVSTTETLETALVSIDQYTFSEDAERKNRARLRLTEHLARRVQRIRVFGTSAVDLAWTAEGRLDACVMLSNKPWDTSAGVLIAREAGARVLDHDGSNHSPQSSATIAVAPALETELMAIVRTVLDPVATS